MESTIIDRILKKNCALYRGVYASDELPTIIRRPSVIVANTEPASHQGEHWVCLYFDEEGHGEFFDSFGMPRKIVFKRYMDENCIAWTFNNKRMQSIVSKFCGHYCIWFCLMKNRNVAMYELVRTMTNDTGLNDYSVHRFACKLL